MTTARGNQQWHRSFFDRPELVPVLILAMSAVIDVLELDDPIPPDLFRELEQAAASP